MSQEVQLPEYLEYIKAWHEARNLVGGSNNPAQFLKLIEEVGELAGNLARGKDIRDDVGDVLVVLANILAREGLTFTECAQKAWEDIRHRKGRMVNGVFIKEGDN